MILSVINVLFEANFELGSSFFALWSLIIPFCTSKGVLDFIQFGTVLATLFIQIGSNKNDFWFKLLILLQLKGNKNGRSIFFPHTVNKHLLRCHIYNPTIVNSWKLFQFVLSNVEKPGRIFFLGFCMEKFRWTVCRFVKKKLKWWLWCDMQYWLCTSLRYKKYSFYSEYREKMEEKDSQNTFKSHQFDCNWVIFDWSLVQKQKLQLIWVKWWGKTNEEINSPSIRAVSVWWTMIE